MANAIGKASLILNTATGKLASGLDSAYAMIAGFKNRIQGAFSSFSLGGLGKLAAVGAGIFGLSKAVESIQSLAEVGKTAERLGVATENLMGLSQAAKEAGVNSEEFVNLLGKVQAKAGEGSADTAAALTLLGTSVVELRKLAPDEQFLRIADGIAKIQNPSQQAALATKLFKESGVKLLPVLRQGSDALRAFIAEQQRLGIALSGVDIAKAMRADESLERLSKTWRGTWQKIIITTAPAMETIGNAFSRILEKLSPVFDWISRAFTAVLDVAIPVFEAVVSALSEVVKGVASWATATLGFAGEWPSIEKVIVGALRAIGIAGAYAWDVFKIGLGAVAFALAHVMVGLNLLTKGIRELIGLLSHLPSGFGGDTFTKAYEEVKSFAADIDRNAMEMRQWGREQMNRSLDQSADQVRRFFDKLAEKPKEVAKQAMKAIGDIAAQPFKYQGTEAALVGRKEEYTARVRFEMQSQTAAQKEAEERRKQSGIQAAMLGELQKFNGKNFGGGGVQLGIV